jgi:N-acetylglucosamine kinase-like BadF-type ATPase
MGFYAGFDLGGSNARILLTNEASEQLYCHTGNGISLKMATAEDAYNIFQPLVRGAAEKLGVAYGDCLGACVAAAGVDTPELNQKCREIFVRLGFAEDRLLILNDCEVFVYQYNEPAIVLTAGTGSIAFGRVPGCEPVRCGGWGRLLSDEGSGFDMGLRVLRMIGNHLDGRMACPTLYRLFSQRSPLRRPADIDAFAIENLITKKEVAGFAPLLIQAADQGDALAQTHLKECIDAYVSLIVDTFSKMALPAQASVKVLLWGGILTGNAAIAASVAGHVKEKLPGAVVGHPEKDALHAAVDAAMNRFGSL